MRKEKSKDFFKLSGKTAIFIDAANLERSVADLGTKPPNFKKVRKGYVWKALLRGHFKANSKLVSTSFYSARFETKAHDNFLTFLKRNGFRLVTKKIKEINSGKPTHSRKANFDVEISVDAVEWMRNYDSIVLFSGDSDFAYLLNFIKRKGKKVFVISERGHVANELVRVADNYRDLHVFKGEFIVPR